MASMIVIGTDLQGMVAAILAAKNGVKVTMINCDGNDNKSVFHLPYAIPLSIVEALELKKYGLDNIQTTIENPFQYLPFYEGLKTLVHMFQSLEHDRPDYKEKAWRDAWGTFEVGRILADYDENIQSLFVKSATLSLVDLLAASGLDDTKQAQIIALCTLGAKTDPFAKGSAAAILPAMAMFERDDCAYFYGDEPEFVNALQQASIANNIEIITSQKIERIETSGKKITGIILDNSTEISADYYILDYDPVLFFKNYMDDFSLLPAFKNRIFPKQNTKEAVRAIVHLKGDLEGMKTQIFAESIKDIQTARAQMKTDGGSQKPIISFVPNVDGKNADIIAQYFDPDVDSPSDSKAAAIKNALIAMDARLEDDIETIEIVPLSTQFGCPTFTGTMPLLQLFKIFFGHHSLAYDMPISNLMVAGYGELCANHHHVHDGGMRVSSLLQSL